MSGSERDYNHGYAWWSRLQWRGLGVALLGTLEVPDGEVDHPPELPEMVADLNLFGLNAKEVLDGTLQEPGAWILDTLNTILTVETRLARSSVTLVMVPNAAQELWQAPPYLADHRADRLFNIVETWCFYASLLKKWSALRLVAHRAW